MAQKTKTINGKKVTAKQIEKQFTSENELPSGMYSVTLKGEKFAANYYYNTDAYYIPDDIAPDGVRLEDKLGQATYLCL